MALFDAMDEIARRQILKTDTGDNRIFGVVTGVVTDNYSSEMPGRVCVRIPVRDKDKDTLKWARLSAPSGGSKWGHFFVPEVDDQVLLAFDRGNIERPYVIGCISRDADQFLKQAADSGNQYKKIMTKNGSNITFEDRQDGDGDQDKVTVETAKGLHCFTMDNGKSRISISDNQGENQIVMMTEQGTMSIRARQKLKIEVGDNISLTLNASSGTVTLKCGKLNVKADDGIKASTDGLARMDCANLIMEASSSAKVSSSKSMVIEGTPVKMG